jgi:hypothetical protein
LNVDVEKVLEYCLFVLEGGVVSGRSGFGILVERRRRIEEDLMSGDSGGLTVYFEVTCVV